MSVSGAGSEPETYTPDTRPISYLWYRRLASYVEGTFSLLSLKHANLLLVLLEQGLGAAERLMAMGGKGRLSDQVLYSLGKSSGN